MRRRSAASSAQTVRLAIGLRRWFGLREFRPGQEEVVRTVLAGRDALAVMPTIKMNTQNLMIPLLTIFVRRH